MLPVTDSYFFYLDSDHKRYIHYEIVKNVVPKTTIFIHGNLSSNRWWYPTIESAHEKKQAFYAGDIILAEIRGCGRSSDVSELDFISIEGLAEEFLAFVAHLKLQNFNIVGHSTGGSIAFLMLTALNIGDGRAVLVDPVGVKGKKFEAPILTAFENMKTDAGLVADVMRVTINSPDIEESFFREVVVADALRAAKVMGAKIANAFMQFNGADRLFCIQNPVLVLHGELDQVLPIADSRALADAIPGALFKLLPDMGHCPNLQDPKALWTLIFDFLYSS